MRTKYPRVVNQVFWLAQKHGILIQNKRTYLLFKLKQHELQCLYCDSRNQFKILMAIIN